jgi:hypothetical protein
MFQILIRFEGFNYPHCRHAQRIDCMTRSSFGDSKLKESKQTLRGFSETAPLI